tara:strand:- start:211 stop:633 length:423 start_codon:yes stop_codon:yes gene_type:complete
MGNDSEEILGIDYGEKRIGISISMLNKKIAVPHSIIQYSNKENAIDEINEIVEKNKIKLVVLGIPKTLKNEIGFKAKEVLLFRDSLQKKINIDIELEDERLSTVQALKSINKNSKNKYVDDSSAAIILNNYLEKLRPNDV